MFIVCDNILCWLSQAYHNPIAISSSITLYITSSARHSWTCLPSLDPYPLNSHLTYLEVLLTFPARSCEDHIVPAMPSSSFTIKSQFSLPLNFSNLLQNYLSLTYRFSSTFSCDITVMQNWYAMIPIVTPEIDICET